jgi:hypothetical protein
MATILRFMAAPGLAAFCRVHSTQAYAKRNVFCAVPYAWRVTALPLEVAALQRDCSTHDSPHRRIEAASWAEYDDSPARELAKFIAAATHPPAQRPATVEACGTQWSQVDCIDSTAEFWIVYRSAHSDQEMFDGEGSLVVAFRGGDGGLEDAKHHPGSPARAFIEGAEETIIPSSVGPTNATCLCAW